MKRFLDINPSDYEKCNLILDVDGTIVVDKADTISTEVLDKVKKLGERNNIYICSNGSPENAQRFAHMAGCKYLICKKPFLGSVLKMIKPNSRAIVIGDKFLTDGLFAKFLGADFIKVEHLKSKSDSPFIKFSYLLDDMAWRLQSYIRLIRPWQWVKNLLVFAPLFFAVSVFNHQLFLQALLAFLAFCASSSFIYVMNDMLDSKQDRLHPKKKNRPIASGEISKKEALLFMVLLAAITFAIVYFIPSIAFIMLLYIAVNLFYSLKLKHIAVLDIILVSLFYILRVIAGGLVTNISLSPWIIICVFFGSLFIIIGKRRAEHSQENRRSVLNDYSTQALDFMLSISAALTIITYGIWSVIEHDSPYLVYSTVFVVFVFFKILNRIYTHPDQAEYPELLVFKDKMILFSFLAWAIYVSWIFYQIPSLI